MRNYLVVLNKPSYVNEICIYTGEVHKRIKYKTEVVVCAVSEDAAIHKIGKLYGYDVSIRSVEELDL